MKAQFVYENMDFERGQDPKETIGIGKKAQIDEWFEEWAPDAEYVINPDLSIEVKEGLYLRNTSVDFLPDNLNVGNWVDLSNTKMTHLPDNLNVRRWLDIRNTQITSLPDNLSVGDGIFKDF